MVKGQIVVIDRCLSVWSEMIIRNRQTALDPPLLDEKMNSKQPESTTVWRNYRAENWKFLTTPSASLADNDEQSFRDLFSNILIPL